MKSSPIFYTIKDCLNESLKVKTSITSGQRVLIVININDMEKIDSLYDLSNQEKTFLNNITNTYSKKHYIASRIIVGFVYQRLFNIKISSDDWKYNYYGKPYIDNSIFSFNISHSKDLVLVAFHNENIAVDIEFIYDMDYKKIVENVFNSGEVINYNQLLFFKSWTAKEAYIKNLGLSLDYIKNLIFKEHQGDKVEIYDVIKKKVFFVLYLYH